MTISVGSESKCMAAVELVVYGGVAFVLWILSGGITFLRSRPMLDCATRVSSQRLDNSALLSRDDWMLR